MGGSRSSYEWKLSSFRWPITFLVWSAFDASAGRTHRTAPQRSAQLSPVSVCAHWRQLSSAQLSSGRSHRQTTHAAERDLQPSGKVTQKDQLNGAGETNLTGHFHPGAVGAFVPTRIKGSFTFEVNDSPEPRRKRSSWEPVYYANSVYVALTVLSSVISFSTDSTSVAYLCCSLRLCREVSNKTTSIGQTLLLSC